MPQIPPGNLAGGAPHPPWGSEAASLALPTTRAHHLRPWRPLEAAGGGVSSESPRFSLSPGIPGGGAGIPEGGVQRPFGGGICRGGDYPSFLGHSPAPGPGPPCPERDPPPPHKGADGRRRGLETDRAQAPAREAEGCLPIGPGGHLIRGRPAPGCRCHGDRGLATWPGHALQKPRTGAGCRACSSQGSLRGWGVRDDPIPGSPGTRGASVCPDGGGGACSEGWGGLP